MTLQSYIPLEHGLESLRSPVGPWSTDRSREGVRFMNKSARFRRLLVTTAIAASALYAGTWRAEADFMQTNLVSDMPNLAAITDSMLVNPWGMSHTATSPIWTSNQGSSTANLFGVPGNNAVMKVAPRSEE